MPGKAGKKSYPKPVGKKKKSKKGKKRKPY